ncbi:extracellular solute-binding protein [Acidovorax sp. NCPPB 2350]|nr:extracellular solute-binding protein [Acidovorax sp. NCPPB 2350]
MAALLCALALAMPAGPSAAAPGRPAPKAPPADAPLQIWHCWAAPGEQGRSAVLARHLARHGLRWNAEDAPVCGSGGALATYTKRLQQRKPRPVALVATGETAPALAARGVLLPLDAIAREQDWDTLVPPAVREWAQYQGHWIAAPLAIHSTNMLRIDPSLLGRLGATPPQTWEDLLALLRRAKAAGIAPLDAGSEAADASLWFDAVAAATGGAEFYRRFFLEHDPLAYDDAVVRRIFQRMAQLRPYLQRDAAGRAAPGRALLRLQGGWFQGEWHPRGPRPGRSDLCAHFPGTQGMVLFVGEQIGFVRGANVAPAARQAFMRMALDPGFQQEMAAAAGTAPARTGPPGSETHTDAGSEGADACGRQALHGLPEAGGPQPTPMAAFSVLSPRSVRQHLNEIVAQHLQGRIGDARAAARLKDLVLGTGPVGPER